jgi:NCAIR mutase (PurE)-related protein
MSAASAVDFRLDFDRRRRTGLDEAVFAEGKSAEQLIRILRAARARGNALLLTRLSEEKYRALGEWTAHLDYCETSRTAFFDRRSDHPEAPRVAIVSGGTSDASVAREAERTLAFSGVSSASFLDVGVAGLWRLTACLDAISEFPVVIAVAGMDAALPTVLAGLVAGVIIAVPTSVGYGVASGGETALRALLASCAPGLVVVNIDNGYGAACAALRSLQSRITPNFRLAEV